VPFLRATRDKRGYETTYVVHTYRSGQGTGRTRVLYLFRTPGHIAIGRRPLDDEARVALEHTHPDLSFDWQALDREMVTTRPQPAARPVREGKGSNGRPQDRPATPRPPAPPAAAAEDGSLLARTLGVREASRLRTRYADLVQRIGRRARGPEERDQLLERVGRLNPDGWDNEADVRAGVSTVEAEWDAIGAGLPSRRRGRRGGRQREGMVPPAAPRSGIIAEDGDVDEGHEDVQMARSDLDAGDPGDSHRVGGAGTADGVPGDD
jgi:hypothetical protein